MNTHEAFRNGGLPTRFEGIGVQTTQKEVFMRRIPLFKLLTNNQDEALAFYTKRLGFEVAEDNTLGDYRWLLVRLPDNKEFCINLEAAKTAEQKALVGRQAADLPLFSIETDNCKRDYSDMKSKGVQFEGEPDVQPYGTGVMLRDLYGNRIYMNQEPTAQ
jgi:catechol 2,3-dioxygenase-like lactoylglutathione lyase family enzyme